jgi:hypothetical protein
VRGYFAEAYARLSDQKEKYLDDLSTRFYKDEDRLEERLVRYMGEHAKVMREAAGATSSAVGR